MESEVTIPSLPHTTRHPVFFVSFWLLVTLWESQVVLVVKNLCASAEDLRDAGSIPGLGGSPGGMHGNRSSILAWRTPWTEEPGGLRSMGLHSQTQLKWPSRSDCSYLCLKLLNTTGPDCQYMMLLVVHEFRDFLESKRARDRRAKPAAKCQASGDGSFSRAWGAGQLWIWRKRASD